MIQTLIHNARIISPMLVIDCGAVLLEAGKITAIFTDCESLPEAKQIIDAKGNMLVPGFIDIHTHGAGGYDVCDATLEALEAISKFKLEEGTTSYCPTTLTLSNKKLRATMKAVAAYLQNPKYAKVAGVHLEGPFVNPVAIGAQNPDYVRLPNIEEVKVLNAIAPVSIITYAPELPNGLTFTEELEMLNIIPSAGHSSASYSCICDARKVGLRHLTHFCNQMTPMHHREIGMVGTGLMNNDLLIEVICDKIHISEDMLRLIYQLKSKDKIAVVTDSLAATGLGDGDYEIGGLPIYIKDGTARLKHNNALSGSTLRMNIALKNIHEVTGLPIEKIIQTTSYNQAKTLGLQNLGKIEIGFLADLVLLDRNFNVEAVFIEGEAHLFRHYNTDN